MKLSAAQQALMDKLLRQKELATPRAPGIPRRAAPGPAPLSFAQERLWFLEQLTPGSAAYNMAAAIRFIGALEVAGLEHALTAIVARHEALRTTFQARGGVAEQVVHAAAPLRLPVQELAAAELEARCRAEAQRPFELAAGPLLGAQLWRVRDAAEPTHVLMVVMHHIVSDGWSLRLLAEELGAQYRAWKRGEPLALAPLPIQVSDHAVWQRAHLDEERLAAPLAFWQAALAAAPEALELPGDHRAGLRAGPEAPAAPGDLVSFHWDRALTERLEALARRHDTSLFVLLLAAFKVFLFRHTHRTDLVVGTPEAGREPRETEALIGLFVNPLALRTDLSGDPSFRELLQRVRRGAQQALAHRGVPFELLVARLQLARDTARTPLFQTFFTFQEEPARPLRLEELEVSFREVHNGAAKFELTLSMSRAEHGLAGTLEVRRDVLEEATARQWVGRFEELVRGIVAEPERAIGQLPVVGAEERGEREARRGEVAREYEERRIEAWVGAQVARSPEATAVVHGRRRMSYRELWRRAEGVAAALRRRGVGREALVGVCLERTPELVAAVVGILKAGCAYVPLDPSYPGARLGWVMEDTGAEVVVTGGGARGQVEKGGWMPAGVTTILMEEVEERDDAEGDVERAAGAPSAALGVEGLAYLIYTSGSTGRPKGVEIEHRSVSQLLSWAQEVYTAEECAGVLASTSLAFDLSVFELFVPLSRGGKVVLADHALALVELESAEEVTLVNTVPSAAAELVRSGGIGKGVQVVNLAGEALGQSVSDGLYEAGVRAVYNLYGPSEDTTYSTYERVRRGEVPTIGAPIANTRAYVVDGQGQEVPRGVVGELYLGGKGLARGYWRRAELTAERFVRSAEGERRYRTGDLARVRADGRLEFLGRMDGQIKLRGFRIELGEIEAGLRGAGWVREAAVAVREDRPGDARLVAYWVREEGTAGEAGELGRRLEGQLREKLPGYMVPGAYVELARLPRTANGKLDRRALPAPAGERAGAEEGGEARAAWTATEQVVAGLWEELLGERVRGRDESFFALGGHSLLAVRLVARARELFGVELSLRAWFEAPSLAAMARTIDAAGGGERGTDARIARVSRDEPSPMSFGQRRLWLTYQLAPDGAHYNLPIALRLGGALDAAALADALTALVARHEGLRTAFCELDGEPRQRVLPASACSLRHVTVPGETAEARREEGARLAREEARRPFALEEGAQLRATLLRLEPTEHHLLLTLPHIVADGWSLGILGRELSALYRARREGAPLELPPLPLQYVDYAAWQQARGDEAMDAAQAYWRAQLSGVPFVLELPSDRARPPVQRLLGARHPVALPAALHRQLEQLARAHGGTLFMVLLSAFQILLARTARQDELVVACPVANRQRRETEGVLGFFVNTLALRASLSDELPWLELLAQVREAVLGAHAHQDYPFEKLLADLRVERDASRSPLVQVAFSLQQEPPALPALPGLEVSDLASHSGTAKFDLSLELEVRDGQLGGAIEYATDLFDASTIARIAERFEILLEGIARTPELPIGELPWLSAAERAQVLYGWNDTAVAAGAPLCVAELVARQAALRPEALAVASAEEALRYGELEARAGQLAAMLRGLGAQPGAVIAIALPRSVAFVVTALAIWKSGAAYLPLELADPPERRAFQLRDAGALALVTERRWWPGALPEGTHGVYLDEPPAAKAALVAGEPPAAAASDLAYVIYTSGSSGEPKGVAVEHHSLANLVRWHVAEYGVTPADRASLLAGLAFDASVWELWPYLCAGASVHVPPGEARLDPEALARWLGREAITLAFAPTPLGEALLASSWRGDATALRALLVGGDVLHAAPPAGLPFELVNHYGPTEGTVVATAARIGPGLAGAPPIGRPIANTRAYVLDRRGQPVPVGVPGELVIGGGNVARGYLGRAELTAQRFAPDPWAAPSSGGVARLYRTGDLCRFDERGALHFLGRLDDQVKLRGLRIELGEIEAALRAHPGVAEAAVGLVGEEPRRALAAYWVERAAGSAPQEALRAALEQRLPAYMVPAVWMPLERLPTTSNGKLDRRALPSPPLAGAGATAPRDELEAAIAEIWSEVLGVPALGVHDNFFALGGHSLSATQIGARLRERLGIPFSLELLFRAQTVAELARELRRGPAAAAAPAEPPAPRAAAPTEADDPSRLLGAIDTLSDEDVERLLQELHLTPSPEDV